jgi:2-hydroxychromene-2-carboxylate isomerase
MPMMSEFWFDFGSPTTDLAHTQLPRIARETGAQLTYQPMRLGGVFKAAVSDRRHRLAGGIRWP